MLYRIKYLLGTLVALFSIIYLLLGTVGWLDGTVSGGDLITCFALASAHLAAGTWLLLSSMRQYKLEHRKLESIVRHIIRVNNGRVHASQVARMAEITEDDAREYLEKRISKDVAIMIQSNTGSDVFFFGQQFWNN